jgi:hypothetical protein
MEQTRSVAAASGSEAALLKEIGELGTECIDGIDFLLEELERQEPDPDERCGIFDLRHEVYALAVPGCRSRKLAVSIDRAVAAPQPCTVHGVVTAGGNACRNAARRASDQLGLINPAWETA